MRKQYSATYRAPLCKPYAAPPILIGYARVSTGQQSLDLPIDALKQAGCDRVFTGALNASIDTTSPLAEFQFHSDFYRYVGPRGEIRVP